MKTKPTEKAKQNERSVKLKCDCENEFQDKLYGPQIRVHTTDKKGNHHCTVCGGFPAWINRLKGHANLWTKNCL
jgi:hypothetical protein